LFLRRPARRQWAWHFIDKRLSLSFGDQRENV
jgi:hypothetical protein